VAPAPDETPEETNSAYNGLNLRVPQPRSPALDSATGEADTVEALIAETNPEIKVYPTAEMTFGDDPDYNEFRDLINNPWQLFNCTEDFKQAFRFIEAHSHKSQIHRHLNNG